MSSILFSSFPKRLKTMVCSIGLLLFLGCCILFSSKTVFASDDLDIIGTYTCREVYRDSAYNYQASLTLYPASGESLYGDAECSKMYERTGTRKVETFKWLASHGLEAQITRCMALFYISDSNCVTWSNWIKQYAL